MPKKLGYLRPYKSYVFRTQDPIVAKVLSFVTESGLKKAEISRKSGVSPSTLHNWQSKKTKRPQFCTVEATARSCGKTLVFTNYHK